MIEGNYLGSTARLAAALFLVGCAPQRVTPKIASEDHPPALDDGRAAFEIVVPAGCNMSGSDPSLDFQVFRVVCKGTVYAGVYVGNAADTSMPRSRLMTTHFSWPSQVQSWSEEVPGDQARADEIAASVRVRAAI